MTWSARNGGMLRGRWRTTYTCDTCGHPVRDDHPDWKHTRRLHERVHEGQPDLFDQTNNDDDDDGQRAAIEVPTGDYL